MPQASGRVRRVSAPVGRPLEAADVVALVLGLAVGTVVPLVNGADPVSVLTTLVAGMVLGSVTALAPVKARFLVLFGVLLAGIVLGGLLRWLDELTFLTWFVSVFIGGFAGSLIIRDRASAQPSASKGEPVLPTGDALRALWDEGEEEVETLDPAEPQVFTAVRALDGENRTFVSLFRGTGRLDVAGDARGAVMVFHSDDRSDHRTAWHHLTNPELSNSDEEVVVSVGRLPGHFGRGQTTTLKAALRAVEHFLATGGRAPVLHWHGDRDVVDMRAPLQSTD